VGVAVDTNILVRRITNDHPVLSPRAKKFVENAKPASLVLDRLIFEELGYVLASRYGFIKSQIAEIYQSLLNEPVFYVNSRELVSMTVAFYSSEKPLSFEDCWLLALKKSGRVSNVKTFDAALKKRLAD
jgi:predicted nucleic-acid-binding protein